MDDPLELQTAVNFVLESEQHLEIAVRMAKAFPVAQRQIAASVLDALEQKLGSALGPQWEICNCKNELFVSPYPAFTVWSKDWGDEICLNLENQTREGGTVVGIWREKKSRDTKLDNALSDAFVKKNLSGARNV